MIRELTAVEVLEIAEQMEREAAKFYRRAAGMYDDPRISKLFSDLAQWEKRHIEVFAGMKERLAQQAQAGGRFALDPAETSPLEVPRAVFNEYSEPAQELTGRETRVDVLKSAIQKERNTIGYYTALTEFALGPDNTPVINDILEEERRHVRILKQSLQETAG